MDQVDESYLNIECQIQIKCLEEDNLFFVYRLPEFLKFLVKQRREMLVTEVHTDMFLKFDLPKDRILYREKLNSCQQNLSL